MERLGPGLGDDLLRGGLRARRHGLRRGRRRASQSTPQLRMRSNRGQPVASTQAPRRRGPGRTITVTAPPGLAVCNLLDYWLPWEGYHWLFPC